MIAKALKFAAMIPKRPTEALDRLSAIVQSRWEAHDSRPVQYDSCGFTDALLAAGRAIKTDLLGFLAEPQLSDIESAIEAQWATLSLNGPFHAAHNADLDLGRLCYCVTRAIRPMIVVETGVCYGVTSAFVLQALECNSKGHLHSIDLPPLHDDADGFVGRLIPDALRKRWTLHRGTSRRLLSPVLKNTGTIDIFIHDSLHTYRNMKAEISRAWNGLRPGGILIADDVQGNRAFQELTESVGHSCSVVVAEQGKTAFCGLMVKPS